MICRVWRGWTTPANAAAYEAIVRGDVIPEIEARRIPGFRSIDLMRRTVAEGVEFATLMWFDDVEAVKTFAGEDYEVAHVPERARHVLARFDERSAHFESSIAATRSSDARRRSANPPTGSAWRNDWRNAPSRSFGASVGRLDALSSAASRQDVQDHEGDDDYGCDDGDDGDRGHTAILPR